MSLKWVTDLLLGGLHKNPFHNQFGPPTLKSTHVKDIFPLIGHASNTHPQLLVRDQLFVDLGDDFTSLRLRNAGHATR